MCGVEVEPLLSNCLMDRRPVLLLAVARDLQPGVREELLWARWPRQESWPHAGELLGMSSPRHPHWTLSFQTGRGTPSPSTSLSTINIVYGIFWPVKFLLFRCSGLQVLSPAPGRSRVRQGLGTGLLKMSPLWGSERFLRMCPSWTLVFTGSIAMETRASSIAGGLRSQVTGL